MNQQGTIIYLLTLSVLFLQQSCSSEMACPSVCTCDSLDEEIRLMCSADNKVKEGHILEPALILNISELHIFFSKDVNEVRISFCKNLTETNLIEFRSEGHAGIPLWTLKKEHLSCFQKLRVLQLRDMGIAAIENGTFSNLLFLKEFDVSKNRHLLIDSIVSAFRGITATNLKIFNISMIHSWENTPLIEIDHDILNIFRETNLKVLDISWIRASLLTAPLSYYIPKVEVINVTGTNLMGNIACMSSVFLLKNLRHLECNSWPTLTNTYRIPRSSILPSCNFMYTGLILDGDCFNLPRGLEVLYMQTAVIQFVDLRLKPIVCFNPSNVLKFLSFRGSIWTADRPFTVFQGLRLLETFDLSGMGLSIISPDTFRYMPSLKYLDLSFNNLYEIDITLLVFNGNLTVLDLSRNKLDSVSWTVVTNNCMLETLNLTQNSLKSFKVNLRRNCPLTTIDVSHNNLKPLDLSEFYYKVKTVNETITVINITNTSIVCECSTYSKRNFEWFLDSRTNSRMQPYPDAVTCGHYDLRELTSYSSYRDIMVDKCKIDENYLTLPVSKNYLTLAISLPISIGIIICCIAGIVCYKVQRKNNNIRSVFISAASDDLHVFVMKMLLPRLEEEMTKERPFDCKIEVMPFITGFDMTPGENIEDQMQAFIKESLCVIAIISENFLESPYCSRELEIAQQLQRKIIPLCIDNCKQKINDVTTHKVIQDVMQKYAYIQWPLVADTEHVIQENENGIEDYQHGMGDNYNVNVREENQIEIVIDGNETQNVMNDTPTKRAIKLLVESIRRTYRIYTVYRGRKTCV